MDASEERDEERARILVVGGGFGGLFTALELTRAGDVTLVANEDHFLHTPLLYEYLSGEVEAWHIAPRYTELIGNDKVNFVHGGGARPPALVRLPRARRRRRHELLGHRGGRTARPPLPQDPPRRRPARAHDRRARPHPARGRAAGRAPRRDL